MKKAVLAARVILGLVFVVFSLNYFSGFFELPPPSEPATNLMGALVGTGYLMTLVKIVELVAGVLLLAGVLVPLALTLLAPIVVNIILVHVFLDPAGLPIGILVLVLELFLAWAYRDSFRGVLEVRAQPS
jgi:hypothetical protein